jgi:ABC-2 type transport system permease protein
MNRLYLLHVKMIISNRLTLIFLILTTVILLVIVNQLSINSEEKSSIPIGIANEDQSKTADELVLKLKKVPALYIYEGNEKELKNLLGNDKITAYFIIEKGYENSVRKGNTDDIVRMCFLKGNEKYKILSDIIAGEMLYPICLYKGYNMYQILDWEKIPNSQDIKDSSSDDIKLTRDEYEKYTNSLTTSEEFDFAFSISFLNTLKKGNQKEELTNAIIYQQITLGIVGMLYAFIAMFVMAAFVAEKENAIHKRVRISLLSPIIKDLYQISAALTFQGLLSVFLLIILGSKISEFNMLRSSLLFLLLLLFSLIMLLLFLILSKVITQTGRYQLVGTLIILVFGTVGYLHLISGFIDPKILNISKIIPNNWFIRGFTDIILSKSLQDIPYESFAYFAVAAIGLCLINGLIGLKQKQ